MGLITSVHVHNYTAGEKNVFGPGDDVPEWAAVQMGAHCFEDGVHPFPNSTTGTADGPPPQSGKGSSKDAWTDYATANGVDVDPDGTRDDIIAACTAAGVPTE